MIQRWLFALVLLMPVMAGSGMVCGQELPASFESAKTRPNKQEIIDLMVQMRRMPAPQQDSRLEAILKNASASKTPRSDFLLCIGLAYLGNGRAQTCAGSAYENGRGVVEDLLDAYVWYAIAQENASADKEVEQFAQAARERVTKRLLSNYPSPTDEDLEDMVKAQKSRIAQYQEEAKK